MNTSRYNMNSRHIDEYINLMKPSEPREDFHARLRIYTMRHDIVVAGLWPNWIQLLGGYLGVKEQMLELLAKYPNGINDSALNANQSIQIQPITPTPEEAKTEEVRSEHAFGMNTGLVV
ncbi:hypothetical protein ACHAQH_004219 [Verticillium albo-atrum]